MDEMKNDHVLFSKIIKNQFIERVLVDVCNRKKIGDNILLKRLNNYQPNIKLNIKLNPSKFLDTKASRIHEFLKFNI